jgi:hypothetical protein
MVANFSLVGLEGLKGSSDMVILSRKFLAFWNVTRLISSLFVPETSFC